MQTLIPESELILNNDGSIYHLHLKPEHIADTIITVGDPERVEKVSQYFDKVEFAIKKREFITHTGFYKNKRITVISSGMGTDNVEILLTELDALVNIDLANRSPKKQKKSLNIIRVGTSGSMHANIPIDSLLVSRYAIGLDTLMCFYQFDQTSEEEKKTSEIKNILSIPFSPYIAACSEQLLQKIAYDMKQAVTLTCPGFYAPQGREVRLHSNINKKIIQLNNISFQNTPISNFEMETAGYYALGKLLNHNILSVNAILANRITHQFSKNPNNIVDQLIRTVLERI